MRVLVFGDSITQGYWAVEHGFGESEVTEKQKMDYYTKIADWINNES